MATYLVAAHYLPLHRAAAVLTDLCAAPVSPGSVASWVQRGAAGLQGPPAQLARTRADVWVDPIGGSAGAVATVLSGTRPCEPGTYVPT